MNLLTVGTVAFDDIETPLGRAEMAIGGAATYIALAAAHFTDKVFLVSVIGDDFSGGHLKLFGETRCGFSWVTSKRRRKIIFLGRGAITII